MILKDILLLSNTNRWIDRWQWKRKESKPAIENCRPNRKRRRDPSLRRPRLRPDAIWEVSRMSCRWAPAALWIKRRQRPPLPPPPDSRVSRRRRPSHRPPTLRRPCRITPSTVTDRCTIRLTTIRTTPDWTIRPLRWADSTITPVRPDRLPGPWDFTTRWAASPPQPSAWVPPSIQW